MRAHEAVVVDSIPIDAVPADAASAARVERGRRERALAGARERAQLAIDAVRAALGLGVP